MRKRVPDEATCAICGRHFDPSETRGWCPNPSCGEWQHPSFPIGEDDGPRGADDGGDSQADAGTDSPSTPTKACPNCGNEVRADANFCKHCASQLSGSESSDPEPEAEAEAKAEPDDGDDGVIQECPDCGADLSQIPSDRLSTCPICMFDLSPVIEEGASAGGDSTADSTADADARSAGGGDSGTPVDAGGDAEPSTAELTRCPNCGEDLTPIPPEMRTVCPGCRVDLEEGMETDTSPSPRSGARSGASGGTSGAGRSRSQDTSSASLESLGIADGYVQRLSEIGITTVEDLVGADADTVSAQTGISARRVRGWRDDAPVDGDATATVEDPGHDESGPRQAGPGGAGGVDLEDTRIQRSPDDLVLEVMGQEIEVTDGADVGREVRNAMVEAGAPEEDAVYVHRKHIRIEFDDEGFTLTRLGENSLTVNGREVEKGSQVGIEDGDEIGFSNVVTATVRVR
ncbi:hypothetical protein BRC65_08700 [Halobacteriales archaeon QH_2_65_14]|nr:MAG: hypothetical protein BRC65_08700 [Halobacteriales archaeon QH_2_65_14]